MSASSQTNGHPVKYGRLNGGKAWRPNRVNAPDSAVGDWIQVTFDKPVKVTAIATQGRNSDDEVGDNGKEWVTKYKVQYSNDGSRWMYVLDNESNGEKVSVFCLISCGHCHLIFALIKPLYSNFGSFWIDFRFTKGAQVLNKYDIVPCLVFIFLRQLTKYRLQNGHAIL